MKKAKEKIFTRKLAKKLTGEAVIVPDGYTSIGAWAFFGNRAIKSITLPQSITSIAHNAFYKCYELTKINIPAGVTSIGKHAFRECHSIKKIKLPKGLMHIGEHAFAECVSLKTINFPSGLTVIKDSMFRRCNSLSNVTIPGNITSIGNWAFCDCPSLKEIEIPDSVTNIGDGAFAEECSLESIYIPASVVSIGKNAFCCSPVLTRLPGIADIIVDDENPSYSSIDGVLFNKNKTILLQYPKHKKQKKYVIPDGVVSIGENAFDWCENLTEIVIPKSVKEIKAGAFNTCRFKSIVIPEGVERIGNAAFAQCASIKKINIPASVTLIGERAFNSMWSLRSIKVDPKNPKYSSANTALIENGKTLLLYPRCSLYKKYHIPEGITHIAEEAFESCDNLQIITVPDSVISLERAVFASCDNLVRVILPDSIKSIPSQTFFNCKSLREIEIPAGVCDIDKNAFDWCENLSEINVSEKNANYSSLNGILCNKDKTELLLCPKAYSKNTYSFVIPDSFNSIGANCFSDCKYFDNITIPKNITSICPGAFGKSSVNSRLTIFCYEGTTAHIYAMSLLFKYRIIKADDDAYYPKTSETTRIERNRFIKLYPCREQVVEAEVMEEFKKGVDDLCKKYGLSLGHDDLGGSFKIVSGYDPEFMQWFMSASDPNAALNIWHEACKARGEELYLYNPSHVYHDRYSSYDYDEEMGEYWLPGGMDVDMSEIEEDCDDTQEKEI